MANSERLAIVVGINYRGSPCQLGGCENDAARMASYFAGLGYAVSLLTAAESFKRQDPRLQPTRGNVAAAIKDACSRRGLKKLGFFFAGHGTQMRDQNGDEADGQDEALVCQNAAGAHLQPRDTDLIRDDDLIALFHDGLRGKGVEAYLMFDACHSGTVGDLRWELHREGPWTENRGGHRTTPPDGYKMLCFSAAQDNECALETAGGGNMTNKFLDTLKKGSLTLRDFRAAFARMSTQAPHITATHPLGDASIFGITLCDKEQGARTLRPTTPSAPYPVICMRIVLGGR